MLGDEYGRTRLGRKFLEEAGQRMDSAGRSAERQQFDRPFVHRPHGPDRAVIDNRSARCPGHVGAAERAELAEQHFGEAAVEATGAGFGQRVGGAERKRGDGFLRPLLG